MAESLEFPSGIALLEGNDSTSVQILSAQTAFFPDLRTSESAIGHGPYPPKTPRWSRDRLGKTLPMSKCSAMRERLLLEKYGKRGMRQLQAALD
jgi:hypothetical protein